MEPATCGPAAAEFAPQGNPLASCTARKHCVERLRMWGYSACNASPAGDPMSKSALLMTGPMMPLIRTAAMPLHVHRLHEAADREALLKQVAPKSAPSVPAGIRGLRLMRR